MLPNLYKLSRLYKRNKTLLFYFSSIYQLLFTLAKKKKAHSKIRKRKRIKKKGKKKKKRSDKNTNTL